MGRKLRKPAGMTPERLATLRKSFGSGAARAIATVDEYGEKLQRNEPLEVADVDELWILWDWIPNVISSAAEIRDLRASAVRLGFFTSDFATIVAGYMSLYRVDPTAALGRTSGADAAWAHFKGAVMAGPPAPPARAKGARPVKRGRRPETQKKIDAAREYLAKYPNAPSVAVQTFLRSTLGGISAKELSTLRGEMNRAGKLPAH